jgi:AraC-like DNA-binding protein
MGTATSVMRHESELGSWELVSRGPDQRLRAYVGEYQGYVESGSPAPLRQQVPAPLVPIIVNFGSPWNIADSPTGPHVAFDSFVAGLGVQSSYVAATGPATCLQVNVTPLGAHMLFGLAMHELANEVVALENALPRDLVTLAAELEDAACWEARFALLDATLARRLAAARGPSSDVEWAWNMLGRTHGRAPIGWICDRLGRSRRHLAARFREQVGLTPKTVARIMRFDRAVALVGRGDVDLAEVAFECGYFDQAHLNRDFREFAGSSPSVFMRRIVPDGGVIL